MTANTAGSSGGDARVGRRAAAAAAGGALAAAEDGLQLLKELQDHGAAMRRDLLGGGFAVERLVVTVRWGWGF
jgi:hypothetical protein